MAAHPLCVVRHECTQVYEITLTRGYDEASFRDDLKQLYGGCEWSCAFVLLNCGFMTGRAVCMLAHVRLTPIFPTSFLLAQTTVLALQLESVSSPHAPQTCWTLTIRRSCSCSLPRTWLCNLSLCPYSTHRRHAGRRQQEGHVPVHGRTRCG